MKKSKAILVLSAVLLMAGCISATEGTENNSENAKQVSASAEKEPTATATPTVEPTEAPVTETPTPSPTEVPAEPTTVAERPEDYVSAPEYEFTSVPDYNGSITQYVVNNNVPLFTEEQIRSAGQSFEYYAPLDRLGKTTYAMASVGQDLMPTEKRGDISSVHPVGWWSMKNSDIGPERCHIIGYQLSGENDRDTNLMTGTHQLNVTGGMLEYENKVADYVHSTGNHVLYRVTCDFRENEDLARGVLMEGRSVEDNGAGVQFCVYIYNAQEGWTIDYLIATAERDITPEEQGQYMENGAGQDEAGAAPASNGMTYVLNTSTRKIHTPGCPSAGQIADHNRAESTLSIAELEGQGYSTCKRCLG